jgi:hypothetical protein
MLDINIRKCYCGIDFTNTWGFFFGNLKGGVDFFKRCWMHFFAVM